jgi:hypothetical protein
MLAVSFSCWARARQIGFVFAKKLSMLAAAFSVGRERDK